MSERSKPPKRSPKSSESLDASTTSPAGKPEEPDAATTLMASEGEQREPGVEGAPESEVSDRQLWRRGQWAAIRRENAASESLRTELRNKRAQVDADIKDREERTKARIQNERKLTQAKIEDRQRRTEAEMSGLERRDKTTQVERYFWMVVAAVGLLAAIVLAFVTAGHGAWEYRVSPTAGLLLLGGSGFRLWSIARSRPED